MRDWLRWTACCVMLCSFACDDDGDDGHEHTSMDAGKTDAGKADAGKTSDAGKADAGAPAYSSETYSKDENWLCKPGASNSRCKDPVEATEIGTDNALSNVAAPAKVTNKTDCFYVYPTIDVLSPAGHVKDYSNIADIWTVTKTHFQAFGHQCTVYAPLYHQITINSYQDPMRDKLLEEAYVEIEDAFRHYMAQYNKGRDVILIGHSQGSHMLRRLLQKQFEGSEHAAWRKQLSLAVLVGTLGDITVPKGEVVGGTFKEIPICKTADERGCVITYNTYPANMPPNAAFGLAVSSGIPAGSEAPCTNPAAMDGSKAQSAGAYFLSTPSATYTGSTVDFKTDLMVKTDFVVFRKMYSLECKKSDAGQPYLAVTIEQPSGATRKDPIKYDAPGLAVGLLGTHVLDYNLAIEDVAALIKKHVETK